MYDVQIKKLRTIKNPYGWGPKYYPIYGVKVNGKSARRFKKSTSRQSFKWICPQTKNQFLIKLDAVLKGTTHRFTTQSSEEIALLQTFDEEDRQYFPEVLAYGTQQGTGFVMQPLYDFIRWPDYVVYETEAKQINKIVSKYHLGDIHPFANCGVTKDGRPIIYDFGVRLDSTS